MNRASVWLASGVCLLALTVVGCGDYPTAPSSPEPGPVGATVTITSSGVSPKAVMISVGQSVTFVNNDSIPHDMASDPHPVHNECPSINRVGRLEPGASAQTGALTTARSCGYHDLLRDGDTRWQGTITIQ
jgi:plastocyanin